MRVICRPGSKRIGEAIRGRGGFTILELIIVGVILGILAGIAVPVYFTYLKRARQVEAPVALNDIKRLESAYFAFNGNYGSLQEIGYRPSPSLRYFKISLELVRSSGGQPEGYKATASGNLDRDDDEDIWVMTQDGILQHVKAD
ncbi:MAG: prepilin-type N-terminal cleavage/methylation domain-containing protein [Nitrospirae bacterium]|nr:prepilin-type N-terminal cleavage/methylation domain-containing protein [Nitrospirota bacterium]